jgi:hypothetical protein
MATLHLLAGPWAAGKSTLVPHLARLLPEVVVFDWDALLPGLSEATGRDAHGDASAWPGLRAMWADVIRSVLAGGRDVLLCGPATPDDFAGIAPDPRAVRCAYLDCPDEVLARRLRHRGERPDAIDDELAGMAMLRQSPYDPVAAGDRDARAVAAEVAGWVRAAPVVIDPYDSLADDSEPLPFDSIVDLPVRQAAATIALFALRAGAGRGARHAPVLFVFDREPAPLSAAGAIDRLAEAPKPVDCVARMQDGALAIQCRPAEIHANDDGVGRAAERARAVRRVLFIGGGRALLATAEAAIRWERDYKTWVAASGSAAADPDADGMYRRANATRVAAGADECRFFGHTSLGEDLWDIER